MSLWFYHGDQAPLEVLEQATQFGWQVTHKQPSAGTLYAEYHNGRLSLTRDGKTRVCVDFAEGANAHRQKFGGGKGQAIAKAAGLNKGALPKVLDATAGMGKDAFVLASLGCQVTMVERQPAIYMMLLDGMHRARHSEHLSWFDERLSLRFDTAHNALHEAINNTEQFDVVYLDPMFPHREKSAAVKKDMALFQSFVGFDDDADQLLPLAMALATKRVVVKRPDYAPFLNNLAPSAQIETKKNRFDLYIKAAMK